MQAVQELKTSSEGFGKVADQYDPVKIKALKLEDQVANLEKEDNQYVAAWKKGGLSFAIQKMAGDAAATGDETMARKATELMGKYETTAAKTEPKDAGWAKKNIILGTIEMMNPMAQTISKAVIPGIGLLTGASEWARQGAGDVTISLMKEGVDFNTARSLAMIAAPLYAAVEYTKLGQLTNLGRKQAANAIKKRLLKLALEKGVDALKETGEEGVQGVITETAKEIGRKSGKGVSGDEIAQSAWKILKEGLVQAAQAAPSMTLLSLLGLGAGAGKMAMERQQQPPPAAPGTPAAPALTVTPPIPLKTIGRVENQVYTPEQIFQAVWEEGTDINLVGGMTIHKAFIHGGDTIELKGVDYFKFDEMKRIGINEETVQWKHRFFIPSEPETAIEIIRKLTDKYKPTSDLGEDEAKALNAKSWDVEMPLEATGDRTINKTTIMDSIEKLFGVSVRGKATKRFKNPANYYPEQQLIRMKTWGELEVATHEIAHHIDEILKKSIGYSWKVKNSGNVKEIYRELSALDYDKTQRRVSEGFAEFLRHYLTTNKARDLAPEFYKFFTEKLLPTRSDIRQPLEILKGMMDTWYSQGSLNRVISQIDWKQEHVKLPGIKMKLQKAWDWWVQKWVTSVYPMEVIEKQLGITPSEKIRPTQVPSIMMDVYKLKAQAIAQTMIMDKAIDPYGNVTGPGMVEILKPIKRSEMKEFIAYGVSRRAIDLHERGKESGIDIVDAKQVVEKHGNERYRTASDALTKWSENLLDWLVWGQTLSGQLKDRIREMNPVYLPFKRAFLEETMIHRKGGRVSSAVGGVSGIHRLKGSGRPVVNPIESLIFQATNMVQLAIKTKMAANISEFSENDIVSPFIKEVPAPMEATRITLDQIEKVLKDLEINPEEQEIDINKIITIFTPGWDVKGKSNIVAIWKGGERKFYEVDPTIYSALTSMDMTRSDLLFKLLKPLAMFARARRLGATSLRVAFSLIKNPARDIPTAAIFSKHGITPWNILKSVPKGVRQKEGTIEKKFRRIGGGLAGQFGYDRSATMKIYDEMLLKNLGTKGKFLMVVKHPINAMRDLLSFWEMAPRMAELQKGYDSYRKKFPTWTEEDAFLMAFRDAQDITVNFTRNGEYGRIMNEPTAFFNVAIQGPDKMLRALRDPITRKKVIIKGLGYLSTLALITYFINRGKDWWDNLPDEYKYSNFFFEIDGNVYRLPIPFELGIVFCSSMWAALDHDKDAVKGIARMLISQLPDIIPSAIQPIIEVWRNRNYLGRPLVTRAMENLPIEKRKEEYTSQLAVLLSKGFEEVGIDFAPVQINHLLDSYTGGFSRQIPLRRIEEAEDFPVISEITVKLPEKPKRQLEDFYVDYKKVGWKRSSDIKTVEEGRGFLKLKNMKKIIDQYNDKLDIAKTREHKTRLYNGLKNFLESQGYK